MEVDERAAVGSHQQIIEEGVQAIRSRIIFSNTNRFIEGYNEGLAKAAEVLQEHFDIKQKRR